MADAMLNLATKRLAWRQALSAEDLGKIAAEKAAWTAEETKDAKMGEFAATFTASDTNGDGLLTIAEFDDCMNKLE